MRIERIEMRRIRLELVRPFVTASGSTTARDLIILKVYSDIGVAYGEACPMSTPGYSYETTQTAWHVLKDFLLPAIINRAITSVEALHAIMDQVRGHRMAKAGIESAYYNLLAAAEGQSLARYLGGERNAINVGISLGIPEGNASQAATDELAEQVGNALEQGYKRIKIKIKPGWDLEPVLLLRQRFGEFPLMVDANSAYSLDHIELLRELDQYGLLMIEQPLAYDDLYQHSQLQNQIQTPICLDESIESLADARAAIALGACKIINVKLARVGGFLPAIQIHDLCQEVGLPLWVGGMYESGLGKADSAALGTLPNFQFPADIAPSQRYFKQDIVKPGLRLVGGQILLPEGPGRGVKVDEEFLQQATQAQLVLK